MALGLMFLISVMGHAAGHLPTDTNNTLVLGWDCSRPTSLDVFERSSFCHMGQPTPKPGHPTTAYAVAQVVWVADIEGWDCRAISTLTTHICGVWGYEKAVPSMSGRTMMKLTPEQCNLIVKRGLFKTAQGRTITGITAPGYTTTSYNSRGWDGLKNGDAACLGVKAFKADTGEELEDGSNYIS